MVYTHASGIETDFQFYAALVLSLLLVYCKLYIQRGIVFSSTCWNDEINAATEAENVHKALLCLSYM